MLINTITRFALAVSGVLTFYGCIEDAPFENPYDTRSGTVTRGGVLRGIVSSYYDLNIPLDSARVTIFPDALFRNTDNLGYYEFNDIPAGDYMLYCQKAGYATDSVRASLANDNVEKNFRLNAIPRVAEFIIRTHHISRWWPVEDRYLLEMMARVSDKDGINEIDSVWMSMEEHNFSRSMTKGEDDDEFGITFLDYELPVSSIHMLQGEYINVWCSDLAGNVSDQRTGVITRIIDVVPQLVSPVNQQEIHALPLTLVWQPVFFPYPVTYKLEIYQVNFGLYTKISEIDNIPPEKSEYVNDTSLVPGDYFWLLYLVDNIGNTSSSKEGTFRIPE